MGIYGVDVSPQDSHDRSWLRINMKTNAFHEVATIIVLLNNDAGDDNESPYNDSAEHDANQNKDEDEDETDVEAGR